MFHNPSTIHQCATTCIHLTPKMSISWRTTMVLVMLSKKVAPTQVLVEPADFPTLSKIFETKGTKKSKGCSLRCPIAHPSTSTHSFQGITGDSHTGKLRSIAGTPTKSTSRPIVILKSNALIRQRRKWIWIVRIYIYALLHIFTILQAPARLPSEENVLKASKKSFRSTGRTYC